MLILLKYNHGLISKIFMKCTKLVILFCLGLEEIKRENNLQCII